MCLISISLLFNFNAGNLKNPWVGERSETQISVTLLGVAMLRKPLADPEKFKSRKKRESDGMRAGYLAVDT